MTGPESGFPWSLSPDCSGIFTFSLVQTPGQIQVVPNEELFSYCVEVRGSWDTWRLECWTHDSKVASLNPCRSGQRIFFSRVNIVYWHLFGVCSIPTLLQWHIKDPSHSAKSAGGRIQLNMHTPLTQQSMSGLTMPLSRHSVGTYQERSSHTTHQRTLGHSRLSSLSYCGLILALRVELARASSSPI